MSEVYVRICPVCGAEHAAADNLCACGTMLIAVDLVVRGQSAAVPPSPAGPLIEPPAPSISCRYPDCGAENAAGSSQCVYCGRPIDSAPIPVSVAGLYNLPSALRANFTIDQVLPAGGAEAELMLLKGNKTGVRVMAKLYRPGIAPKGAVLEQVALVAHGHVVRLLAHGVSDGIAYEVMEYCTGGSLRDLMAHGTPTSEQMRVIVTEIAEALAALHACRVIHRDLKPENVLVRRTEPLDLVLTDFGIASLRDSTQLFTGTARTARYAAPEAMTGILDDSADYWSLGMMVLELLRGEHPFANLSDAVIAHRLATGGIDTATVRDPHWRRLCRGLLQREPGQRWGISEVRRWLAGDDTLAEPKDPAATQLPVYRIVGDECRSMTELAVAFSRHWQEACKDLARGQFESWAQQDLKDHDLIRYLHDLKERGLSPDLQVFLLVRHLAPAIPLSWRGCSLEEESILANAALAADAQPEAVAWLDSLFSERVIDLLPADNYPFLAAMNARCKQAWLHFGEAWQAADSALGEWRNGQLSSGEVIADYDSLLYGIGGGLHRPSPGQVYGPLLLALYRADYARQLRVSTLVELSRYFEHSPWIEAMCRQAEQDDDQGLATLVAVLHLLPQARKASEDGHQRVIARKREQADDVDGLILRLNETLVDLKHSADNLTIFFGDDGRQHLALRIEEFGVLGDSLRRLVAGSGDNGQQTLRGFGRAEPLVLAIRDRLDDWESTQRINELWRGERVINVVAGGLLALILFAPRWLPAVAVVPITFFVWRVWIVAHHRTAIRKLVARLPLRLPGISSS